LWVVQIMAHAAGTFSTPRNRNWRKPRACLIYPNTGSTTCFLAVGQTVLDGGVA
jgi:hypothetical protein